MDKSQGYAFGPLAVGDFYAARRQPEQAAAAYRHGAESDWDNRNFYRKKLARLEFARGNRAEAKSLLDAVLKDQSGDIEAVTLMQGLVLGEGDRKDAESAVATLRTLAEQMPDRADGWHRLAVAQEATGDVDGALQTARRSLQVNGTYLPALLLRARLTAKKGDNSGALTQANQILQAWPENQEARLLKARLLFAENRLGEARAELRELEKALPGNPSVEVLAALMAAADGRSDAAEAQLRRLYKPGDAAGEARDALVRVLQSRKQHGEATALLEREVRLAPDNAPLRQQYAEALLAAGKADAAVEQYREIVSRDESAITPRLLLGYVLMAQNRNEEAAGVLAQASRKDPKNGKALFLFAQSLERQGKHAEAIAGYRQVLAVEPANALAMNNIGYLLAESGGNLNEAQQLVGRAMQASQNAAVYMDTLGYIYLKQRKTDLALQTFQTLVQKDPENSTYRYHLGMALLEKGQRAQARDEMEKALRRSQDPQERQRIQESISRTGA
jgi:predicted Zn-dependent protease